MGRRVLSASASTKQRKSIKPTSISLESVSISVPLSRPIRTPSTPDALISIKSLSPTLSNSAAISNDSHSPNSYNSISDSLLPNPSAYPSLASKPISTFPLSNAKSSPTSSSIASRKEPFPIPNPLTSLASATILIPLPPPSSSVSIPSASPVLSTAPDTRISSNKCRISSIAAVADVALLFDCYRLSVIKRSELNPTLSSSPSPPFSRWCRWR